MRICEMGNCANKHYAKGLCKKHYQKQYIRKNKEKIAKQRKQYRIDNKEQIAKQRKQYRKDNVECFAEYDKQWHKNNPKYRKQWHQDNPKYNEQYQQDNKEVILKQRQKYRQTPAGKAIIKASSCNQRTLFKDLTKEIVQRVYEDNIKKYGILTCYLCFKSITNNDDSLEHLTPLSRGGTNEYKNLGIAHLLCNMKKHAKTLKEWFNNKKEK